MHGLVQVFYMTRKAYQFHALLTRTEVEEANKVVAKVLEPTSKTGASRGNYNSYTSVQRGEIGKYAAENGETSAAKHFYLKWNVNINESTKEDLKLNI